MLFYMLCWWLFSVDFTYSYFAKMHLWRNSTFSQVFFFLFFNIKALIFEFEWRKCISLWVQELHQAVTLILYPWLTQNQLCLTILSISTSRKKNPPLWCCLVYCLMYSSLLILQTRCFFFQWKVLTGEIFKVVLKANKPFVKNVFVCLCAGGLL